MWDSGMLHSLPDYMKIVIFIIIIIIIIIALVGAFISIFFKSTQNAAGLKAF